MADPNLPPLTPDELARRSSSFGGVAEHYERFRPGPPLEAVNFLVPEDATTVVDLGAGTGAMTRILIDRVDDVVAIEPDDRMREVLTAQVPRARALKGRGESMPLEDGSVDAVLASSSWHWVDQVEGFTEVARVLRPGGVLGAVWSGPDVDGPFLSQAQALLAERSTPDGPDNESDVAQSIFDRSNPDPVLTIPDDAPFSMPERLVTTWDVALDADDLIGLLGTFSWVILLPDGRRAALFQTARDLLRDGLGVHGNVTVDVAYRSEAWRSIYSG